MRNFIFSCLLCTATLLLLNQQTVFVEAKPFLLLPRNFFVLTTRAPCTKDGQTNCNSNPSTSFSTSSNFQIPNLITPKLSLLSTLLQGLSRGGSSGGGIAGGFGFGFKKVGGLRPAATTTTTTSSPSHTTEPGAVFEPDSSESTTGTITSRPTSVLLTSSPGYSYENKPISSNSNKDSGNGATSNVLISSRVDTKDGQSGSNGNNGKSGNNDKSGSNGGNSGSTGGTRYNYESSNNVDNGSSTISSGIDVNNGSNDNDGENGSTNGGITISAGFNSGNGNEKSTITTSVRSGYQYNRPAENEVA